MQHHATMGKKTATPVPPANHPNTSAKAERAQPRLSRNFLKHETLPHYFFHVRWHKKKSSPLESAERNISNKSESVLQLHEISEVIFVLFYNVFIMFFLQHSCFAYIDTLCFSI